MRLSIIALLLMSAGIANAGVVTLNGSNLTQDEAWAIAEGKDTVAIAPEAMDRLKKAHELVLLAAKGGTPVYGLTVGVGLNKDKPLFKANGELSEEVIEASKAFNHNALRSHSAAIGPMMSKELTRLQMVIRLNTLLAGQTGAQPYVAELYKEFLNKGITPEIPSRGSVGEADITMSSHVGAVMMGEWRAKVDGKEMSGKEALQKAGLKPLVPEGKDALAILSTNAAAVAETMDAARHARTIIDATPRVFALSLEALNGNIAPVLPQVTKVHPFSGLEEEAAKIRDNLKGSYLWEKNKDRALQDPLSFRTTVYTMREAREALKDLDKEIKVQINSSDDNPATILNAGKDYADHSQVAMYFVEGNGLKGAIIPTSNFEPLPVAMHADSLAQSNPVSALGTPVAGDIEDTYTNLPLVAERLKRIADNTGYVYSLEMLHSTQGIDLRKKLKGDFKMSEATRKLYQDYRAKVPYVSRDRIYTDNIEDGKQMIMNGVASK